MKNPHLLDSRYWRYSLYAMPIMIPLALWTSWEEVLQPASLDVRIGLGILIGIGTYLGGVALFWWNAYMQHHWRKEREK